MFTFTLASSRGPRSRDLSAYFPGHAARECTAALFLFEAAYHARSSPVPQATKEAGAGVHEANVWVPELPELEPAFKDLGHLICEAATHILCHCDAMLRDPRSTAASLDMLEAGGQDSAAPLQPGGAAAQDPIRDQSDTAAARLHGDQRASNGAHAAAIAHDATAGAWPRAASAGGSKTASLIRPVSRQRSNKGRLLYYYPVRDKLATSSAWCGWHFDHGTLTGASLLCLLVHFLLAVMRFLSRCDCVVKLQLLSHCTRSLRTAQPWHCMCMLSLGRGFDTVEVAQLQCTPCVGVCHRPDKPASPVLSTIKACAAGLTSAMYLPDKPAPQPSEELACPDTTMGLHVRTRAGAVVRVAAPRHQLLFQAGQSLQVLSGGRFRATEHFVAAPATPLAVSRSTFAVFCQPKCAPRCQP